MVPVTLEAIKKYGENEKNEQTNERTKIVKSVKADERTKGDMERTECWRNAHL